MNNKKSATVLSMAGSIALLPPIWAVLSGHIGVRFGAAALICAAVYASAPPEKGRGLRISLGFLLGDLWAVLSLGMMARLPFAPDVSLYVTLFIMGGLAVLISGIFDRFIFCPAWLGGLAIGLTILTLTEKTEADRLPLPVQIAISMLMGIWYVGFAGDQFAALLRRIISNKKS